MKFAHNVKLSVFAYDDEDSVKIASKLKSLCPFSLDTEKVQFGDTVATGFKERKIHIFEIILTKERHTSKFLEFLKSKLSGEDVRLLLRQLDSRLDSELFFFIRIDKKKLIDEDCFQITDSGDCFHIRLSVAAYPATRESALSVIKKWLLGC